MECITDSDLIDQFIEYSALTPSNVICGGGGGGGGKCWVGNVAEGFYRCNCCLCVLLMLLAILGKLGSNSIVLLLFFLKILKSGYCRLWRSIPPNNKNGVILSEK